MVAASRTRQLRHPARPDEILAAACRAIVERGFAQTRVADIAEAAGTSTGTIHYYFDSREEVLLAALRWASERLFTRLEGPPNAPAMRRLGHLLELSIPYLEPKMHRDEYVLWLEMSTLVMHDPLRLSALQDLSERWRGVFFDAVHTGARDGTFTLAASADVVAERLIALVDGLGFETAVGYTWASTRRMRELLLGFACEQLGVSRSELDRHMREAGR